MSFSCRPPSGERFVEQSRSTLDLVLWSDLQGVQISFCHKTCRGTKNLRKITCHVCPTCVLHLQYKWTRVGFFIGQVLCHIPTFHSSCNIVSKAQPHLGLSSWKEAAILSIACQSWGFCPPLPPVSASTPLSPSSSLGTLTTQSGPGPFQSQTNAWSATVNVEVPTHNFTYFGLCFCGAWGNLASHKCSIVQVGPRGFYTGN